MEHDICHLCHNVLPGPGVRVPAPRRNRGDRLCGERRLAIQDRLLQFDGETACIRRSSVGRSAEEHGNCFAHRVPCITRGVESRHLDKRPLALQRSNNVVESSRRRQRFQALIGRKRKIMASMGGTCF